MISFVGAGPGAPDLITLRGAARLAAADVVVWAASLVPAALLGHCRPGIEVHDSAAMTLEEVTGVFAAHPDAAIVRLHSGDPTLYSAVAEQIDWCRSHGRTYEIVPGVSSVTATAAAAGRELTVPARSQTVVLTRLAHRTAASVPPGESVAELSRSGATMAVFLSAGRPEALQAELLGTGSAYTPGTPVIIGFHVSRPDEEIRASTVGALAADLDALGRRTGVLVLVGDALADGEVPARSHVYSAAHAHAFRATRPIHANPADTHDPTTAHDQPDAAHDQPDAAHDAGTAAHDNHDAARDAATDPSSERPAPADGHGAPVAPTVVPIVVVGVHGGQPYGREAAGAVGAAGLVVGSPRHLAATVGLRPAGGPTHALVGPLDDVVDRIGEARAQGRSVCVLASGDPGFFGIVRLLGARFGAEQLVVHPAPSSVALAFARLGASWDDAAVVSAHGRPLPDAVAAIVASPCPSVAVLTSPASPPEVVGRALLDAGEPRCAVTVASHLSEAEETLAATDLDGLAAGRYPPMSVVVLRGRRPANGSGPRLAWGLPESAFVHRDGMITKAEVRAVALGKLALPSEGVLWDLGAGSGSVAIECARLAPALRVIAVERDPTQVERIRANAARHGVHLEVVQGTAPAVLAGLADPDRVFVGGGGPTVLDEATRRLRPGGRIVATYALIERAIGAAARLGNLTQVSVSRGVPTGQLGLRLQAENPVFVCWGPDA